MNRKFLSIIIPAYNVEKYISECIDSISKQSRNLTEIIVVDDGSVDNTSKILNGHKKNGDIDHIIYQKNGGQSLARNVGVKHSQGQYLLFLDADDKLKENSLAQIISTLKSNSLDIVFFDAEEFYDDCLPISGKINTYQRPSHIYSTIVDGGEFFRQSIFSHKYNVSPCMYAFKKSIGEEVDFPVGITSEDNVFTTKILLNSKSKRVMALKDTFYIRRLRDNSEVTKPKTLFNYFSYLGVYNELLNFNVPPDSQKAYSIFMGNILALASRSLSSIDKISINKLIDSRLQLVSMACKNPKIISIRLVFSLTLPGLYNFVAPFFKKIIYRVIHREA